MYRHRRQRLHLRLQKPHRRQRLHLGGAEEAAQEAAPAPKAEEDAQEAAPAPKAEEAAPKAEEAAKAAPAAENASVTEETAAAAENESAVLETEDDGDIVYGNPDEPEPGSQNAENYFTPEEIAGAEALYHVDEEKEEEPTEAEIKAELEEKERLKEEESKRNVDDSDKLKDTPEESKDGEEAAGKRESYCRVWMRGTYETKYPSELIKMAAYSSDKTFYLEGNMNVTKTLEIPANCQVQIFLQGFDIVGDDLGSNPVFKLAKGSTLTIIGGKGRQNRNRIKNGGDGAIVCNEKSSLYLKDLWVEYNRASRNGGGIYLGERVKCELYNVGIYKNTAGNCGGGIYVAGKETNIHLDEKTEIIENTAGSGGGIYVNKSKVNIYGPASGKTKVNGNTASTGGGLYFNNEDIAAGGLEIANNSASGHGGGVRMESQKTSLAGSDIHDNRAGGYGGGVYINGKVGTLTDCEVIHNVCGSTYNGGGIFVDSMDNINTGGKFVVTKNYRGSKPTNDDYDQMDDLYLQNGKKTDAYIHASNYAPGSTIGIGVTDWKEGQRITFSPGSFNPKTFYANNGVAKQKKKSGPFYIAHNGDSKSKNFRHLIITKNSGTANKSTDIEKIWFSEKDKTKPTGNSYQTKDGKSYDLYYGYNSSPSHTDEKKDIVNKYFYSDGYFFDDPAVYNPHLATFGMNLAMASADSNIGSHSDYSFKFDNVKSMLQGIGCADEDIYISPSYIVRPTDSSIGVAIGRKDIVNKADNTTYTLVPIAIRSYGYEKEWASNMTIDSENTKDEKNAEHSGFRDARTKVMNALTSFIATEGLEGQLNQGRVKFFLVGFSRGSATANLTSKALVDTYGVLSDKYKNNPNQVFGYCYAVPSGATDTCDTSLSKNRKAYYCIHNIINKVDLTPMVAPKEMGFKRYGVDHYVPGDDAGTVKTFVDYAWKDNGSYKRTSFYDNNSWWTNESAYSVKKPYMLKQLTLVNDEIHFVDWFKETDIIVGKAEGVKSFVVGRFTESSPVKSQEVKGSTKTLERWLPEFYSAVQDYFTVGKKEKLTRKSYSSTVVRAGKTEKLKKGERNWYAKGVTAQNTFRGLVQMMLSKTPTEKANLGAAFSGLSNKLSTWTILKLYEKLINSDDGWDYSNDRQQDYLDMFWNMLRDNSYGQKAIQDAVTDPQEMADLENYFPSLMSIIFRIVRQDFNDKAHKGKMRLAGTFASNTEAILQGHVPEIALAWLRSYDDYYANETKSYIWDKNTTYPGTLTFTVSGDTLGDKPYYGNQVVKLKSTTPSDAIYYQIWKDNTKPKNPATLLYNGKQGIVLSAPADGTTYYKINAWTKNSRAKAAGEIEWISKNGVEKTITVKSAKEAIKTTFPVKLQIQKWSGGGYENVRKDTIFSGVPFKKWNRVDIWSIKEFKENYDEKYYSLDRYVTMFNPDGNTSPVTVRPKITEIEIPQTVVDDYDPKKLSLGDQLKNSTEGNTVTVKFNGVEGNKYPLDELTDVARWDERKGSGDFTAVKKNTVEPNREYRLRFRLKTSGYSGRRHFAEHIKVKIGDSIYRDMYPYDDGGEDEIIIDYYGKTRAISINDCKAESAEAWVWRTPNDDDMCREGAEALPKYAGTIIAEGKTVSGLEVEWLPNEYSKSGDDYKIKGVIKNGEGTKAAEFDSDDYSWGDRPRFVVEGIVHTVNPEKLLPPAVNVPSGNYTFIYDDIPVNDKGNMKVSLADMNEGKECQVTYKVWEGSTEPPYDNYNPETGVVLEKPEPGNTKTYKLKVSCNATVSGYTSSREVEYTYNLYNPVIYTVKAFAWDINDGDPADLDAINAPFEEEVEKGDEIMVDYEDLIDDEEDLYFYDLVSWNALSKNGAEVNRKQLPGSSDRTLWYTVSDNVYLQALKAPLLSDIKVTVDKPVTGEGLPGVAEDIKLSIGGEDYNINTTDSDSISINWTASENSADDGIAKAGTTYTASISLNADRLQYIDPESGEYGKLDLVFLEDEDIDLNVNGVTQDQVSGNDAGISNIYYAVSKNETLGTIKSIDVVVTFEKSGKATFLMVEPPASLSVPFTVSQNRYKDTVSPNLPTETAVLVDDGSIQTLSVNWVNNLEEDVYDEDGNKIYSRTNGIGYEQFGYVVSDNDLDGLDAWSLSLNGYVTLPDDIDYLKDENGEPLNEDIVSDNRGVRCYFEYPVFLAGAPESNMPEILPAGGVYEPTTEKLLVDFNTFPISTNKVDVYYKITYGTYDEEDEEDEDEDEYLIDPPCWYEEDGRFVVDEKAHLYKPHNGTYKDTEGLEDIKERTINREKIGNSDYARVTAIALEQGNYRISAMAEEYYDFLDKPLAVISDETLEILENLELTSGETLKSITLPENCRWAENTDLYTPQEGIEGEMIDATVVYNNDPVNYEDLSIDIKIMLNAGTFNIVTDDCTAYLMDEDYEDAEDFEGFDDWEAVTSAKAESGIYVSANKPENENLELIGWIVTDADGENLEYEYDEDIGEGLAIFFTMPYDHVRVKPIWRDTTTQPAKVNSLKLDPSRIDLTTGKSAVINATADYEMESEFDTKPAINFKSSNPNIVSVTASDGKATVKALSSGSVTIWADCADKTAICYVYVGVENVSLQLTDCKAYDVTGGSEQVLGDEGVKGSTIKLVANPPKNAAYAFKEWTITGADIDRTKNPVEFKLFTDVIARPEYAEAPGFDDPGEYAYKNVKIKSLTVKDPVTKKKAGKVSVSLNGSVTLDAKAVYKNTTDKPPILFKSSNTDVAKVKTVSGAEGEAQAVIVGCKPGTAVVTCFCGNKTVKVNVTVADEEVDNIFILTRGRVEEEKTDDGQYKIELFTGEQELLEIYPGDMDNTTPMKISWKSDDTKIATVKNGLITAKSADKGHTTVTATPKVKPYGSTKWVKLKPVKIVVRVKQIEIPKKVRNDKSYSLSLKGTQALDLTAARAGKKNVVSGCTVNAKIRGTAPGTLEWKSTNPGIVSVNSTQNGTSAEIKATGIGTAYITLTGYNASNKELINRAVMKVTVKATAPNLSFTNDTLGAFSEDYKTITLKQGSYDRIFYNLEVDGADPNLSYNTTEKITWSARGGVTVADGVIFAKKPTKDSKPATVTLKCGRSKITVNVIVK